MDDFDEADEANEEDLVELGDHFATVNLETHIKESLNSLLVSGDDGFEYIYYCLKQLPKDE